MGETEEKGPNQVGGKGDQCDKLGEKSHEKIVGWIGTRTTIHDILFHSFDCFTFALNPSL